MHCPAKEYDFTKKNSLQFSRKVLHYGARRVGKVVICLRKSVTLHEGPKRIPPRRTVGKLQQQQVILFARPLIALYPAPLKKYCPRDPSKISNLYCDPNTKYFPSSWAYFKHGEKFAQAKKVSILTRLRDRNLARSRANSTY